MELTETHSSATNNSDDSLEPTMSDCTSSKPNDRYTRSFEKSQCYVCGVYVRRLEPHLYIHTGKYPYHCTICQTGCSSKRALNRHMFVHRENTFACTLCDKVYKLDCGLKQHVQKVHSHKERMKYLPCTQCDKLFSCRTLLKSHKISHIKTKNHKCNVCQKAFKDMTHLQKHIRCVHTLEGKPHHCKLCGKKYCGPYDRHVKNAHTEKNFVPYQYPHKCMVCGKSFLIPQQLNDHVNIHTGLKPYKCTICEKGYHCKGNLTIHYNTHKEKVPCEICGKRYKINFLSHHVLRHSQMLRFQCEICGKGFKSESNIATHMKSHSQERPFACDICDGTFKLAHHLRAHKKRHK